MRIFKIIGILFLSTKLYAITTNPASNVTADSAATAFTIPYRDASGQFEMSNTTFTGTGVIFASGTATGINLQQPQAGGNLNIIFRDNTGTAQMSLLWDGTNARMAIRDAANGLNRLIVNQTGDVIVNPSALHSTTITASGYLQAPYWTLAQIQAATPTTALLGGQVTCTNCASIFSICVATGATIQGFRLGASGTTTCQ